MVIYDLQCINLHSFEGWFKNKEDLDEQKSKGLLSCPVCGSQEVTKKLTASKVAKKSNSSKAVSSTPVNQSKDADVENKIDPGEYAKIQSMLDKAHQYIDTNFTDVGNKFADEALKIHRGEKEAENIRGTASKSELKELADEGVSALPLPPKPVDKSKLN